MALLLHKHYSKQFQSIKENKEKYKINLNSKNQEVYNENFSMTELKTAIEKSHNSAIGPDEVHHGFLKQIPQKSLELLLETYNNIWTGKQFPKSWKQATIIPIPKPGKNTSYPENYRPIALTSYLCKTLERMVNRRLVWYLETNNLISNKQCGYKKKRDCLYDLKLRGRLLKFIKNFLTGRTFQIHIGSTLSDLKNQEGVPQGSILSTTLFNIKINNIIKELSPNIYGSLYVGDCSISYKSKYIPTLERKLQHNINKISEWASENGFKFLKTKAKCIYFCNQRKLHNNSTLTIKKENIPFVDQYKHLGLIFDKKLNFIPHINYIKTKYNKALQLLRVIAHTNWGADKNTLLKLYRSLIRALSLLPAHGNQKKKRTQEV